DVTDTIAVSVGEAADVDLVDDAAAPPRSGRRGGAQPLSTCNRAGRPSTGDGRTVPGARTRAPRRSSAPRTRGARRPPWRRSARAPSANTTPRATRTDARAGARSTA